MLHSCYKNNSRAQHWKRPELEQQEAAVFPLTKSPRNFTEKCSSGV